LEENLVKKLLFGLLIGLLAITGCGSSGDDDDSGGGGGVDFNINACDSLGYKVANGGSCDFSDATTASSVVKVEFYGFASQGLCTGVLISPTVVLTASHCFIDPAFAITVTSTTESASASSYATHPDFFLDYNQSVIYNDVALVFLAQAMTRTEISPILTSRAPVAGEEAVTAGYGDDGSGTAAGFRAGETLVADVTVNHLFSIYRDNLASPCSGDSGGALFVVQNNELAVAGVVSQTDPSVQELICQEGDLTLYANTQNNSILSFILSEVPNASTI
jgi:secreted trypsin-like serine protease